MRTVLVKLAIDGADDWADADLADALTRAIAGESLDGGPVIDDVLAITPEEQP
jgi:hypothetical protein